MKDISNPVDNENSQYGYLFVSTEQSRKNHQEKVIRRWNGAKHGFDEAL